MDREFGFKKNIVILGAGFGGITAALKLAGINTLQKNYKIILLDKHHHQLYTPTLYEIASIPRQNAGVTLLKSSILIPLEDVVQNKSIEFVCGELKNLNKESKKVLLEDGREISYEFLIFALGSETNYFNIPGLKRYSLPLKTFEDAIKLRNAIEDLLGVKENIHIVVGGAGASGVELVAEFVNFICTLKRGLNLPKVCKVHFTLAESSQDILPGFDRWIVDKTKIRLAELGIKIKTQTTIVMLDQKEITFRDGTKESYDMLIWTGGVRGPEILKKLDLPLSNAGSLIVDEFLHVLGNKKIYAIGDNSSFINPRTQKPLVWNVPVAEAEGRLVAKNIKRAILGKGEKKFVPLKKYPFILAVGKKFAIADFVSIRFTGIWGWFAKQLIELRYLLFILPPYSALKTWWKNMEVSNLND